MMMISIKWLAYASNSQHRWHIQIMSMRDRRHVTASTSCRSEYRRHIGVGQTMALNQCGKVGDIQDEEDRPEHRALCNTATPQIRGTALATICQYASFTIVFCVYIYWFNSFKVSTVKNIFCVTTLSWNDIKNHELVAIMQISTSVK